MISSVFKRDGKIVSFNPSRITRGIIKAMNAVGAVNESLAVKLTDEVISKLKGEPSVEAVQNIIEDVLIGNKLLSVSKAYALYREKRAKVREVKFFLGVDDDLKLSINSIKVLAERYLLRDSSNNIIETPRGLFLRVAKNVSKAEVKYGSDVSAMESAFFGMMSNLEFLPNSPALMNAGTSMNQLAACFVLPVNDSLESIFNAVKESAVIHHSGGGTGFNFSNLRPNGDMVISTHGVASGPVGFIKIFDVTTSVIKQGGRRRGANMALLNCNHPDVIEFINAKRDGGYVNFNFSVSLTDSFMKKVLAGGSYPLINPKDGSHVCVVKARDVFNEIVSNAWTNGDPGVIFIDEINKHHPLKERISAVNPCGESPLLNYESCVLGSINLSLMIKDGVVDWQRLKRVTHLAVRFLDDIIDVNDYPLKEIKDVTLSNRKIGLGVMGFADLLLQLGVPYGSKESLVIASDLMSFIRSNAREASVELGLKRGSFPNFKLSKLKGKFKAMRNATLTTIAPTGTISIIADCSSGIEPLYGISFVRTVLNNSKLVEVNKHFESYALRNGFYSDKLVSELVKTGSLSSLKVPSSAKELFVTALDISPEWHVKLQSQFQKFVDNAVSKTVNLPASASISDVSKVFLLAYKLKCKGVTVYRYGSHSEQVLSFTCPSC